jgi:hypothetical protein
MNSVMAAASSTDGLEVDDESMDMFNIDESGDRHGKGYLPNPVTVSVSMETNRQTHNACSSPSVMFAAFTNTVGQDELGVMLLGSFDTVSELSLISIT